ncbi:CarD family transcriptional regulator [Bradyrhizobium sp. UFLA06-06]
MAEQRWTAVQITDRVAHALTLAERVYLPDEYSRARAYANTQQARYCAPQSSRSIVQGTRPREKDDRSRKPASPDVEQGTTTDISPSPAPTRPAPKKPTIERQGFRANEFIVYPAHGVGHILAIEEQVIAGAKLELFVINFMKDRMTLRVPTAKVANVGIRKLSDSKTVQEAYRVLAQSPHAQKEEWPARAHEYEAKINSGSIVAIAQVVRDLYRAPEDEKQNYSERQLYEAALDRLTREASIVRDLTDEEALKECESLLVASAILRRTN